ncbi:ArsR/SmtB family transcription factor [Planctomicrobium sp. SH668]|uniref:ArsR/SmtB family transcription factor n=1 Tax=Planctomicrobium sp. SH668 TaxID=3448126 RepID=UPI003F5AEC36
MSSSKTNRSRILSLKDRKLLSPIQAGGLAAVFKVLANDTRLRLLHALIRSDELCVSELSAELGMKPQAVSNQLQRLLDLGILSCRREGNNVFYRVIDICVSGLIEQGWCLTEAAGTHPSLTDRANQCCSIEGEGCETQ